MACRYFMRLAYNGTPFHGWQRQPNAVSVQEELERALSMVLRQPVAVTGAGRTDTGVNARCMWAHFDTAEEIADVKRLVCSLNSIVGRDIAVYSVVRVADDAMRVSTQQAARISISLANASRRLTTIFRGLLRMCSTWRR